MNKLILALGLFACLTACGKKAEEKSTTVASAPTIVPTVVVEASVDEKLAALSRAYRRTSKICYNKTADGESFFINFLDGPPDEDKFHGWYFTADVPFYRTQAGTWYTQDMANEKFIQVYPDVTGLICKVT